MNERSEWSDLETLWQQGGTDVHATSPASLPAPRRDSLLAIEGALLLIALAGIAAAVLHAPATDDLLRGGAVALGIVIIGIVRFTARRRDVPLTLTTSHYVDRVIDARRREMQTHRVGWIIAALMLVFLVPWWLEGWQLHGDASSALAWLSAWLPGAAIAAAIAASVIRARSIRREVRMLSAHRGDADITSRGGDPGNTPSGGFTAFALLFLAGTVSACAPAAPAMAPAAANVTIIDSVNVIPITNGDAVLRHRALIVRDGVIESIAAAGTTLPGATVINGNNGYLIPGLADMHVHLEYSQDPRILGLFLQAGVTTVRNMDGRPYILRWRDDIARGALSGPSIITAGPIIDGDPPLRDDNFRAGTAAAAVAEVQRQAAAGYDFVKLYTNLDSATFRAAANAARAAGLSVSGHAPRAGGIDVALQSGMSSLEHLSDFASAIERADSPWRGRFHWSKPFLGMPVDDDAAAVIARRVADAGVAIVPTLVERERGLAPPNITAQWAQDASFAPLRALQPDALRIWQSHMTRITGRMDDDDWRIAANARSNRLRFVGALHRAGVRLLVGTDTPNPFVRPGAAVHEELALLVEAGLSPAEALAAGTREAARYVGQSHVWGSIAPGLRADLVLVAANPLDDIRAAATPRGVMVRGRWLEGDALRDP